MQDTAHLTSLISFLFEFALLKVLIVAIIFIDMRICLFQEFIVYYSTLDGEISCSCIIKILCFPRLLPPFAEKIWSSRVSVCTSPTLSRNTTTLGKWWSGQGVLGTGSEVRVTEATVAPWGVVALAAWEISAISTSTQPWWLPPRPPCRAVGVWWEC